LLGRVFVGDHERQALVAKQRLDDVKRRMHGQHGAPIAAAARHQFAA